MGKQKEGQGKAGTPHSASHAGKPASESGAVAWNSRFRHGGALWGDEPSVGAKQAMGYFKEKGVRTVLDVACGYGRDSVYLAGDFEVTGIDFSPEGIRMATDKALLEGKAARFLLGDVRDMPLLPDSMDGVLCNGILSHLTEIERPVVARGIERVLRRGGALVVSEFSASRKPEGGEEVGEGMFREYDGMLHKYFGLDELKALFPGIEFEHAEEQEEQRSGGKEPRLKWVLKGVKK